VLSSVADNGWGGRRPWFAPVEYQHAVGQTHHEIELVLDQQDGESVAFLRSTRFAMPDSTIRRFSI